MTPMLASRVALATTAALALAAPLYLLTRAAAMPDAAPVFMIRPIAPQPAPALDAALGRSLFAAGDGPLLPAQSDTPDDGPHLIGIVGRLGRDAVALVRGPDGGSVMLAIGASNAGWRLDSIARDAVLFSRGTQKKRIDLPGGDAKAEPEPEPQ